MGGRADSVGNRLAGIRGEEGEKGAERIDESSSTRTPASVEWLVEPSNTYLRRKQGRLVLGFGKKPASKRGWLWIDPTYSGAPKYTKPAQ